MPTGLCLNIKGKLRISSKLIPLPMVPTLGKAPPSHLVPKPEPEGANPHSSLDHTPTHRHQALSTVLPKHLSNTPHLSLLTATQATSN